MLNTLSSLNIEIIIIIMEQDGINSQWFLTHFFPVIIPETTKTKIEVDERYPPRTKITTGLTLRFAALHTISVCAGLRYSRDVIVAKHILRAMYSTWTI